MEFNSTMYDVRFASGTLLDITSRISGELDENKKPLFEEQLVKYKINIGGCTLKMILDYFLTAVRIKVANGARKQGLVAVTALNSSVVNLTDLLERRQAIKLSSFEVAKNGVASYTPEEKKELLKLLSMK